MTSGAAPHRTPAAGPESPEARPAGEARQALEEKEAILAALSDGVLIYDGARNVIQTNRAFRERYGFDPVGLHLREIIHRVDCRLLDGRPLRLEDQPTPRALRGEQVAGVRFHITRPSDGAALTVESSAGPFRLGDHVTGSVTVWRDVTEQVRAEEALREADRRKNDFLAMLSHELRNPLAPISNSLFILDRAPTGSEQAQRALRVIDRQVVHLTRLVDDLLDVTRISRGKIPLQPERLELAELVRRAVEDHRTLFAHNGIDLRLELPADGLWLQGDRIRLVQVIGNLLQNAAKFTPRGGTVTVSVEPGAAGQAVVRVRDTGAGIDPEALPHLFQPFMQVESTLARSCGGLGLGLALVKGLVEMHGGSVGAASPGPGLGSEFAIRLPTHGRVTDCPEGAGHPRRVERRCRVLVIEDDLDAASSLKDVLELAGHTVDVAHGGAEGVERARTFRPEVVLCDLGLPEMDGYQVARALRSDPALRAVRLVALSGYAAGGDLARSAEAGFDRHLAKPVDLDTLQGLLAAEAAGPAPGSPAACPPDPLQHLDQVARLDRLG